jgi:hypothetical protein
MVRGFAPTLPQVRAASEGKHVMSDFRDKRGGAYDHVNPTGNPQPGQVRDMETAHERAQWGADVRPEPLPGPDEGYPVPEGLRKRRMGPLNKDTGRRPKPN